jgi:hypothetical protein
VARPADWAELFETGRPSAVQAHGYHGL